MRITHCDKVEQQTVLMKGARGCTVRWLISDCEGADHFAMRQFKVAPGGHTPLHAHPYEHEVYVLEGNGVIVEGEREHAIKPGDVILVCPNEKHQFKNPNAKPLQFLCLVPNAALHPDASGSAASTPECQCTDR